MTALASTRLRTSTCCVPTLSTVRYAKPLVIRPQAASCQAAAFSIEDYRGFVPAGDW